MNFQFDAIMLLALFTLSAGVVIGIISFTRAKKAKDHHEDAAVAQRQRHEDTGLPAEGTPGAINPTLAQSEHEQMSDTPEPGLDPDLIAPNDSGRSWSKERGANPPMPTPTPPRTPMPPRN